MIAIIDYGVGNLFSAEKAFAALGADVRVTSDESTIRQATKSCCRASVPSATV